ncbi:DUF2345 domain-containing protein [Psychrobacter sp. N25K4-3-2]|jgi:uncharacterized protein involved in type VI secretion and phage assembly/uncharacterized protein (DUF2345 family)|uniref:contractile injection system protein, VgrG/Pvc8 family n=1 Tax=Psychrobacter sp. N25K4-3-2 TaxID=2785026 RepID=UPI00188B7804|nr:contractile injection system protein, VgrG/Pvc8 family [Psychrobacter sp. N25K4-3-2]MBF4488788.1 DUF2345 domain-containing protein [Psychrobacter sp. N25K4-3-2]
MPSQTARLHQITVETNNIPITTLYPAAFSWSSTIDKAATSQLLFYSHAFLDSNSCLSLINTFVCLNTLSVSREPTHRTGLIKAVNYQHSDGALHFYTLDIVSPDWQLTQCIHTRTFINQSTLDIVTTLFADYEFDWQLSETLQASERLSSQLSMRTQSDVSDWEFITRLLADSGVSTLWISGDSLDNLGCLMLLSSFDEIELLPLDYRYAQSSIQSGQDTVNELQMRSQQLGSQTVIVRADGLSADTIYEGQAADESALATDDTTVLLSAPSRVDSDSAATVLAQQWVNANRCQREHYQAAGAMRGMVVGSPVSIHNLPTISRLTSYCISTQMVGIEPDSDSVSYHNQAYIKEWLQRTTQQSGIFIPDHGYDIARDTGVWVSATLLDAAIPYAPYPSNLFFASHTYKGLTQARTGSATTPSYDSSVTDDNLQQTITTPVYSGISPHDDGTTPPLRALQLSSGSSHGWQFAPRLGQSVLLNHWYGDIDSPVISRSLYDGIGMGDVDATDITTRDAGLSNRHNLQGGASPRWHGGGMGHSQISDDDGHSGWLSGIAQYGLTCDSEVAMSFDDTPSKIGLQWTVNTGSKANADMPTITEQATFAPDEHVLELGILRHRYSNHQSSDSGQGINLATDHGLQITGDTGVLLSTFDIRHSQSEHESAWVNDAGQRQLTMGTELSETFKEAKQAHLQSTEALSNANQTIEAFKTSAQVIDETLNTEVLGAADVMLVSKDSILASASNTLWTAKTIVRQSGSTQSDVVAGNYTLTADSIDSLSGVGGEASASGLHVSANTKPLAIQAQGGELQLHSQQSMTIGSEAGQVNVSSPKRIKLQTSAGASITIDKSGIKLVCPGTIKVKAVRKSLVAGARVNYKPLEFLNSPPFAVQFSFMSLLGKGIEQAKVILFNPDTHEIISESETDNSGMTMLLQDDNHMKYDSLIGFDQWSSHFEDEDIEGEDEDEGIILGEHGSQES